MRIVYITASILLAFIITAVLYMYAIHSMSNNFVELITTLEQSVDSKDINNANKKIEEINNMWKKNSPWVAAFINHTEMEEITYLIKRIKTYSKSHDENMLRADVAELKERLTHLETMEQPTLENLL